MDEIADRLGPVARELLDAWLKLPRGGGGVPGRDTFDPMAITRILPVISVIGREGETWRYRLVGTEIERRWNRRITGTDCFGNVSPSAAAVMRRELKTIVEWPCGSWSRRRVELVSGRAAVIETLRLPLRARDGAISQILSCSGELPERVTAFADPTREIITIVEQEYFDIGAGRPPCGAIE